MLLLLPCERRFRGWEHQWAAGRSLDLHYLGAQASRWLHSLPPSFVLSLALWLARLLPLPHPHPGAAAGPAQSLRLVGAAWGRQCGLVDGARGSRREGAALVSCPLCL